MNKKEIASLCRGINNIKTWRYSFDCIELSERLYISIERVITFCETKFKWNMENLSRNIKLLKKEFFFKALYYWEYFSSDEENSEYIESATEEESVEDKTVDESTQSDNEREIKNTFSDNSDWDIQEDNM